MGKRVGIKFPKIHLACPYKKNEAPLGYYNVLLAQNYVFASNNRMSVAVECMNSAPFVSAKVIPRNTASVLSSCDYFYFGSGKIKGALKGNTVSKLPIMPSTHELEDRFEELMKIKDMPTHSLFQSEIDISQFSIIQDIFKPKSGVLMAYVAGEQCIRIKIEKDSDFRGIAIIKPFRPGTSNFL